MKKLAVLMAIASIGLGALFLWMYRKDDNVPPVITFPSEEFIYEKGQDVSVLLEGVKAEDDVDGDVSDTLIVESVLPMQNQLQATVLYYAKDKSNNVAKASRTVEYRSPEMESVLKYYPSETESEESSSEETENSEKVHLTETETTGEETSTETQSDGKEDSSDTGKLPDGYPHITLTTDRVVVEAGEEYDLLSYVKDITDDVDGPDWLYSQIHIEGKNNINGPGVYELYYSVVDREDQQSNRAKLILTIR